MFVWKPFRLVTPELASHFHDFVGNSVQSSRRRWNRNLAHTKRSRRQRRRSVFERFGYLLPHLRFQQCPVRILRFVSCDQPKTDSNIDAHENDKRSANTKRHFPAARRNIYFAWQQNPAKTPLRPK